MNLAGRVSTSSVNVFARLGIQQPDPKIENSSFDRTFENLKNKTDDYDEKLFNLKLRPKKTLLEKLIQSSFGQNAQKVYDKYPDLALLTQPNYPVISPRGPEIIRRNMFRESLSLLDIIVTQQKQQAEQARIQSSSPGSSRGKSTNKKQEQLIRDSFAEFKADSIQKVKGPPSKRGSSSSVNKKIKDAFPQSSEFNSGDEGDTIDKQSVGSERRKRRSNQRIKISQLTQLKEQSFTDKAQAIKLGLEPISDQFARDCKVISTSTLEILQTFDCIEAQHKKMKQTLNGIQQDQAQIIDSQERMDQGVTNIIDMIKKCKHLKEEI